MLSGMVNQDNGLPLKHRSIKHFGVALFLSKAMRTRLEYLTDRIYRQYRVYYGATTYPIAGGLQLEQ